MYVFPTYPFLLDYKQLRLELSFIELNSSTLMRFLKYGYDSWKTRPPYEVKTRRSTRPPHGSGHDIRGCGMAKMMRELDDSTFPHMIHTRHDPQTTMLIFSSYGLPMVPGSISTPAGSMWPISTGGRLNEPKLLLAPSTHTIYPTWGIKTKQVTKLAELSNDTWLWKINTWFILIRRLRVPIKG